MSIINIGKENATYQEIVALKENRTKRAQQHKFFVEGTQNIKDAIANNWEIESFIFSDYNKLSDWAKGILNNANNNYNLTKSLMDKLSDKDSPSELLAIVKMKKQSLVKFSKCPIVVLADRPSKKGNLGTIIRSCDALNVEQLFYIGHGVDIYDHTVITASMGSVFRLPFKFLESNDEYDNLVNKLKKEYKNFQVVATSLQTKKSLSGCDFTKPTLLLVGNEAKGISKHFAENADVLVKIDMKDGVNSLNVACATSICLYEINRQRSVK